MNKLSLTIVGLVIMVLSIIGINVSEGDLITTITTITTVIGGLTVYYGRWRQGDINFFGIKKTKVQ